MSNAYSDTQQLVGSQDLCFSCRVAATMFILSLAVGRFCHNQLGSHALACQL